ncbi:hypothetical protein [Amycolatopsis sp. SID8362]|uniref:hypothetical protein n=1 Tax=Amycolatopsis sp. SID8362 TaxID=2690346 RepID=UPI001EF349B7|nr:hypothetical protein [Amycolatopsis sp. SID8362]
MPWRDGKAVLDPSTHQAHLTGALAPERETHATTGVDRDHFLEQERWATPGSPEPKTLPQKVAFAFLQGIGLTHTGLDMAAGHRFTPTGGPADVPPPKDHKPKKHEDAAEPAPESTPDPLKPGDPGLPPKFGENAVAHIDPEAMKVDRIDPPTHPAPTPADVPPRPNGDIDKAINPAATHEPGPHPDDRPSPAAARAHGGHPDDPRPLDPAHGHGRYPDDQPAREPGSHPDDPPSPAAAREHGGHPDDPPNHARGRHDGDPPPDPAHERGPHSDDPPPDPGHGEHEHGPHPDDPPPLDTVNARHAESTPSGSSYHAADPDLGDLPHRVPPDPHGRHTVDVHVTPDGRARVGDHHYTPKEFADLLRRNADYDGGPIRLIGCDASSNAFAHGLARELDTEVLAPTKAAWTDSRGRVFSSGFEVGPDGRLRPRIPPDGEWHTHHPDGSTHRAGDDGFAPDTHHGDPHDVDVDSARHRGQRPYDPAERDQDMRDLRRENRDLREEGLDSVRHHDGRNVNPTTDDLRRPHDRALTTSRYRSLEGEAESIHSFSGKTHDWAPASEGPSYPKHERLFETKEAGAYRPELGRPDPEVKFGRTHDSEPKLMEELVRRDFAERSGLPRGEVDEIVRKQIEKLRREEATGSRAYDNGLKGETARARDRMDSALEEINRRGAERASERGETYEPITREGMDGDLRMVVDLPSAKRDNIPVDYQICDSCQDVIMQFEKLFPNVRVEVVNIKGEELIW